METRKMSPDDRIDQLFREVSALRKRVDELEKKNRDVAIPAILKRLIESVKHALKHLLD